MTSMISIVGALALTGGGLGFFLYPLGLQLGISYFLNLKEGGMVFPVYMNPPFRPASNFWIYAVQNPKEILAGEKMRFKIKGPYIYDYNFLRDNISFSNKGDRVKFDTHKVMVANEDRSPDLDEKMYYVNPIVPSVLLNTKSIVLDRIPFQRVSEPIVLNAVNAMLDYFKERLIYKGTPRELLDGRPVELLQQLTTLADRFGLKSLLPPGPPENKFGLAHAQNVTVDQMELWAGVGDTKNRFADVYRWKGKDKMSSWEGRCNIINGTNGELFKPFIEPGKPIKVFIHDLCRTINLTPVSDEPVTVQNGFKALEYEFSERIYQGVRTNPKNRCFCKNPRTYDCQFDGLVSMGPCFFDAPLFFTRTNFKGADRRIRSLINEDSLEMNIPDKQSLYLDPITGTVLKANVTFTGLFKVVRQPYMRDLSKVQNLTYAPLFAVTEVIEVPYSLTWQVKILQVMQEHYKSFYLAISGTGAGLLFAKMLFTGRRSIKNGGIQAISGKVAETARSRRRT